jgi:hypothetical protein
MGGIVMSIPFLPSLMPRRAWADEHTRPVFLVVMRQANGMILAGRSDEPDLYWPRETGVLDPATMTGRDADRATSELAAWTDRLLFVKNVYGPTNEYRGVDWQGGGHGKSGAVLLTGMPPLAGSDNNSPSTGESIDGRIARDVSGADPLSLYAGAGSGYIQENLAFLPSGQWRPVEMNPANAFRRVVGVAGSTESEATYERLQQQRRSINDAVRGDLHDVLGRANLTRHDRQRLELHLDSVRDLEVGMACEIPDIDFSALPDIDDFGVMLDGNNVIRVANLHADVIALAFACDVTRAATLQIGSGTDGTMFYVDGRRTYRFHWISHRETADDGSGSPIDDATELHHQIDRIFLREMFIPLVQKLEARGILDDCIAVHTSELSAGKGHHRDHLPFVIAGSGGGQLKQGRCVDAGGAPVNHVLNTFGAACGVTNAAGDPLDDFGHPSLPPGQLDLMRAATA